jgi:tetratricopeptide (TPR) repeat protein
VRELARAVGGLPLALALIAARLSDHSEQAHWVQEEIVRLRAVEMRLALEAPERRPGLEGVPNTLRAIVEMSVEALGELQGVFEMLGAFAPKPADFAKEAAFAVWVAEDASGDTWLRRLVDRRLVEVAGEGRFALHQVPAAVAEARLGRERGARERHAHFHCAIAHKDAEDWRRIEQEMGQIRQGWRWSSSQAMEEALVVWYAEGLQVFFGRRGLWREHSAWTKRALDAARSMKHRKNEGAMLTNLGTFYESIRDYKNAQECCEQALLIRREIGDRSGEALTLGNLGNIYYALGDGAKARGCYDHARLIFHDVGSRGDEAGTLISLGNICSDAGDQNSARSYYEQALLIMREVSSRAGEAKALTNLGNVHSALGEEKRALAYFEQALSLHRDVGDRSNEGGTLINLGRSCFALGDKNRARRCYERALSIMRDVGNTVGETMALTYLGRLLASFGDVDEAIHLLEQAVKIGGSNRDPALESNRVYLRRLHTMQRFAPWLGTFFIVIIAAVGATIAWQFLKH